MHPALSQIENDHGYQTLFSMHPNVRKIAEFMMANIPKDERRSAARGLAILAPILWDRHEDNGWGPLEMRSLYPTGLVEQSEPKESED